MSRPRILGLCSAYNSAGCIEETLRRAAPHLDEIHVYDGAYMAEFPGATPASTDGTLEAAGRVPGVILHPAPSGGWRTQVEKRTAMLDSARPGDWIIPLDADLWLQNPEVLRHLDYSAFDVGWCSVTSNVYRDPYRAPLLWRHVEGAHYGGRHYWMFDGQGHLLHSHQHATNRYRHQDVPLRMINRRGAYGPGRDQQRTGMRRRRQATEGRFAAELEVHRQQECLIPYPGRAGAPDPRHVEVLREPEVRPTYSLLIPFSRPWAWQEWFEHFAGVEIPWSETEILAVVDHDDASFAAGVRTQLREWAPEVAGIRMRWTQEEPPAERARVRDRRARICRHWRWFQSELLGSIVLGAEDDTLPDTDAYSRLLETLEGQGAGFVQGTEVGRWSVQMIPHWQVGTDRHGLVNEVRSATYEGEDLVRIQGGGWYCFAARAEVVLAAELRWTEDPPMGPDVKFVWDAHQAGHLCLGDWSVDCEHVTQRERLHQAWTPLQQVIRTRRGRQWHAAFRGARPAWVGTPPQQKPREPKSKSEEDPMNRVRFLIAACGLYGDVAAGTVLPIGTGPGEIHPRLAVQLEERGIVRRWEERPPAPPPEPDPDPAPEPAVRQVWPEREQVLAEPVAQALTDMLNGSGTMRDLAVAAGADLEFDAVAAAQRERLDGATSEFRCVECSREFPTARGLMTHVRQMHKSMAARAVTKE